MTVLELQDHGRETIRSVETDFSIILSDLDESCAVPGAYYCDYELFKDIYRFIARNAARSGHPAHLVLYTLTDAAGNVPETELMERAANVLRDALGKSLRRGDLYARYSACQFVVILPGAREKGGQSVAERIVGRFARNGAPNGVLLNYKLRPLEIDQ